MPGRSSVNLTDAQRAAMERARERMPTIQRGSFYLVFEAGFLAGLSREDERLEEGQSLIEAIIGPCSDEATEAAAMVVQEALDAHNPSLDAAVMGRFGKSAAASPVASREDEGELDEPLFREPELDPSLRGEGPSGKG